MALLLSLMEIDHVKVANPAAGYSYACVPWPASAVRAITDFLYIVDISLHQQFNVPKSSCFSLTTFFSQDCEICNFPVRISDLFVILPLRKY